MQRSNLLFLSLMLVGLLWGSTQAKALPLSHSQDVHGQECGQLAKAVLSNISELLKDKEQFNGFNCSEMTAKVHSKTSTVSSCTPTVSGQGCSGQVAQNTQFNKADCLVNIRADMEYYKRLLEAQRTQHSKLSQVVKATSNMLEKCNWSTSESAPPSETVCASGDSFSDRMCLCEVVQGFQLRAITITRALNYIASGDYQS
ncbi:interleukin-12 subunit alpha [Alosa sapidissima]|uniref:interleukin-12 subunit alpha n=1 Tax=Alosa sapidissima TaxID=34773 RepID=UPI001C08FA5C|nr:interleukin-12 subunit alpha [Alosa sapidissima]